MRDGLPADRSSDLTATTAIFDIGVSRVRCHTSDWLIMLLHALWIRIVCIPLGTSSGIAGFWKRSLRTNRTDLLYSSPTAIPSYEDTLRILVSAHHNHQPSPLLTPRSAPACLLVIIPAFASHWEKGYVTAAFCVCYGSLISLSAFGYGIPCLHCFLLPRTYCRSL